MTRPGRIGLDHKVGLDPTQKKREHARLGLRPIRTKHVAYCFYTWKGKVRGLLFEPMRPSFKLDPALLIPSVLCLLLCGALEEDEEKQINVEDFVEPNYDCKLDLSTQAFKKSTGKWF